MTFSTLAAPEPGETRPKTLLEAIAGALRFLARCCDPPRIIPTVYDVARSELNDCCMSKLRAEAELERASHTVQMLNDRIERLTLCCGSSGASALREVK